MINLIFWTSNIIVPRNYSLNRMTNKTKIDWLHFFVIRIKFGKIEKVLMPFLKCKILWIHELQNSIKRFMLACYRGVGNGWPGWAIFNQFFEKPSRYRKSCPFVYFTKIQPCPITKYSSASYARVMKLKILICTKFTNWNSDFGFRQNNQWISI